MLRVQLQQTTNSSNTLTPQYYSLCKRLMSVMYREARLVNNNIVYMYYDDDTYLLQVLPVPVHNLDGRTRTTWMGELAQLGWENGLWVNGWWVNMHACASDQGVVTPICAILRAATWVTMRSLGHQRFCCAVTGTQRFSKRSQPNIFFHVEHSELCTSR